MNIQLTVPTITCDTCINNVLKAIYKVDDNVHVGVNFEDKKFSIDSELSREAFIEAITAAGHEVA